MILYNYYNYYYYLVLYWRASCVGFPVDETLIPGINYDNFLVIFIIIIHFYHDLLC